MPSKPSSSKASSKSTSGSPPERDDPYHPGDENPGENVSETPSQEANQVEQAAIASRSGEVAPGENVSETPSQEANQVEQVAIASRSGEVAPGENVSETLSQEANQVEQAAIASRSGEVAPGENVSETLSQEANQVEQVAIASRSGEVAPGENVSETPSQEANQVEQVAIASRSGEVAPGENVSETPSQEANQVEQAAIASRSGEVAPGENVSETLSQEANQVEQAAIASRSGEVAPGENVSETPSQEANQVEQVAIASRSGEVAPGENVSETPSQEANQVEQVAIASRSGEVTPDEVDGGAVTQFIADEPTGGADVSRGEGGPTDVNGDGVSQSFTYDTLGDDTSMTDNVRPLDETGTMGSESVRRNLPVRLQPVSGAAGSVPASTPSVGETSANLPLLGQAAPLPPIGETAQNSSGKNGLSPGLALFSTPHASYEAGNEPYHNLQLNPATNDFYAPRSVEQHGGFPGVAPHLRPKQSHEVGAKASETAEGTTKARSFLTRDRTVDAQGNGNPDHVEQLCQLQTQSRPVERFFVEYQPMATSGACGKFVAVEEDEALFNHLAEYTDDDSFFSSGTTVLEEDARRLQNDPLRGRAVRSVFETLSLRSLTKGRTPYELEDQQRSGAVWLRQVHQRAIALHHSSFFVFPPGMPARIMAYNIMHHWVVEVALIFIILIYSIITAAWSRDTWPHLEKPSFMLFADVFFLCIYMFELFTRLFASGAVMHSRAFFRSPWHWLDAAVVLLMILNCTSLETMWNYSAFRLLRVLKSCTYVPIPINMKLLAKSLLRSTWNLGQVTLILIYALFFFALVGLQIFSGSLDYRCVNHLTNKVTNQVCRPDVKDENSSYYYGAACPKGHTCIAGQHGNPHNNYRSFDNVGQAFLSAFQIMTFQGWTSLLQETSDTGSVWAIMYFMVTILVCSWIIPSLYLGVFIEKIERTRRLFVQKQLQLFDSMLLEQRQRLNETIKFRDFVERDEKGKLRRHPIERLRTASQGGRRPSLSGSRSTVLSEAEIVNSSGRVRTSSAAVRRRSRWTDEQRVQLHLSLTRQREIASRGERRRHPPPKDSEDGNGANGDLSHFQRRDSETLGERSVVVTGDFALGGRVGVVQHHPLTHTIGAAHGTNLPLAARLDNEEERLRFLRDYQSPADGEEMVVGSNLDGEGENSADSSVPTLQRDADEVERASNTIHTTMESAGVIPRRPAATSHRNSTHTGTNAAMEGPSMISASGAGQESSSPRLSTGLVPGVIIQDPEGGDFRFADTVSQKWGIVRNILHMFTEGYPRIITQYIWEHRRMQQRFGLTPLNYVNKYEDGVLRKLRQKRVLQINEKSSKTQSMQENGEEELMEMNGKKVVLTNSDDIGDLSPIQMATNIIRNVSLTPFGIFMLLVIIINGIFNATRHFGQTDYWETVLLSLGLLFNSLFTLEIIIRIIGRGPASYFTDFSNLLDCLVTILGFFELAYARSNVVTVLNWVRLLRFLHTLPFTPTKRVSRVLLIGFQDISYALFMFSVYMFMWVLIGMSFFGGPNGLVDHTFGDYYTRGNFDNFAGASFAVSQAFSYTREEWLYVTWNGMQSRGSYTVLYFMAVVAVAFISRYFFIAVFAWAWQTEEEEEELYTGMERGGAYTVAGPRLRWFDFTVWRSFKHIHGGFERRDVAPDEVFHLNEDMRRQLRIAEAKERFFRRTPPQLEFNTSSRGGVSPMAERAHSTSYSADAVSPAQEGDASPKYINIGGKLQRRLQPSADFVGAEAGAVTGPISQFQLENAQLRFARHYSTVPASVYTPVMADGGDRPYATSPLSALGEGGGNEYDGANNAAAMGFRNGQFSPQETPTEGRTARDTPRGLQRRSSVSGRFPRLGYDRSGSRRDGGSRSVSVSIMQHTGGDEERNEDAQEDYPNGGNMVYEHVLFPGPRLRYRHVMKNKYTRVFERCMDCNTYQQMPLRAPPNVEQRTPEQLHAEHCHMAAVRSSRQLILNAIMGYVRLQKEISQPPTRDAVETVLGQAWSCGMLLFETIEYLSCSDIEQREYRTWDRTLEALQLQQWLIGLHVGEEQVGRATLAYILAHRKREKLAVRHTTFQLSWRDRSLFFLSPNSEFRRVVTNIVESKYFEWFILAVIFISSFCLCFHIPGKANDPAGGFVALRVFDGIFTAVFLVEMLMKWLSMGVILFKPEAYFWHPWNVFDFTITIVSLIALAPQFSHLRSIKVLRCIRVLAFFRNNNVNRGLAKVSSTILNCIPTVANVLLLFFINYFVWAVIALRLFNGKAFTCTTDPGADNATCSGSGGQWVAKQRNFDTFGNSFLTMIEVSVGSKWLDIIYMGVDGWSSEHAPIEDYYLAKGFFFVVYYYISHLILFSLFTASIVYCYLLTKNTSEGVLGITFEHQLWMRMQRMTLQLTPRVKLVPMKNKASQLLHRVVGYHGFQIAVVVVILLNVFTMSLYWYGEAKESVTVLDAFQYIWTLFFTFESAAMLGSYGMRSFSSWAFCFDFFVLVFSYIQVIVKASGSNAIPFNVNALRMLRVGRFFAVAELYVPVRKQLFLLHEVLLRSAASLANVTLILLLGVFTFAVLGLHLVGGVATVAGGYIDDRYTNFNNFGNSLMMTFRLTTLENWSPLLRAGMNVTAACEDEEACVVNNWSPFFFTLLLVCLVLVILGLYIAVIVDHYITASRMNASVTRIEDLHRFRDLWSQYDPNASLVLPTKDLPKILESLQPPLGLSSRHNRAELLRLLREYDIPDHRGKIYYHEVLLPLARRVLAMAFTRDTMDYRTTFETLWRHSEKSLRALPTVLAKSGNATVAQHFAASYLQAICRRKKAYRLMQQARSDVWRDGRVVCDELGLPYGEYGFGRQSLDGPDPMHEPPQGSVAPADAEARTERRDPVEMEAVAAAVAPSSPTWRSGQADSPSSPMSECQAADGQPTQARLPGTYQPAIDDREKRFGPDVPNALRRHETRSEKLRRKDEERYLLSPTDETSPAAPSTLRSNSQRLAASDYQPPLGTDPTSWLDNSRNRGGNVGTSGQDSRTNSGLPSMQGLMTP